MTGRCIVLSDDGVNLADNAFHRLMAACFFPESPRDQAQALFIADMERAEYRRVSGEGYTPSDILRATVEMIDKRNAQLYGVGLVALAMIWLYKHSVGPSLNRASTIVSHSACKFGDITWRSSLDPAGKGRSKALTGDPRTVARLFR